MSRQQDGGGTVLILVLLAVTAVSLQVRHMRSDDRIGDMRAESVRTDNHRTHGQTNEDRPDRLPRGRVETKLFVGNATMPSTMPYRTTRKLPTVVIKKI